MYKAYVVGAMLRPTGLADRLRKFRSGEIDAAEFKAAENKAVDTALAIQNEGGIERR